MPRSFLVKKSKKGGFRSSLPIADVPYLGLVGWSVPIKVTTLPEESGQDTQQYSPITQQNSTDDGWKMGTLEEKKRAFAVILLSLGPCEM